MGILHKQSLDQILEHTGSGGGNLFLEASKRSFELECFGRGLVVDPLGHGSKHERESLRERSSVELTHRKFNSIHRRSNGIVTESFLGDLGKSIQNELLHLLHILWLNTLESNRKGSLQQFIRQSTTGNGSTKSTLHESLVKNGRRSSHQQMVQHIDRQFFLGIERLFIEEPIDHQHVCFFLIGTSGVRVFLLAGFGKRLLLPFHLGRWLALWRWVKVLEVLVHQFQASKDIVVTGKVDARVTRMVELAVKVSKLLKGQIRNDSRISTAIDRIRVVLEDTALRFSHEEGITGRVDTLHFIVHDTLVGKGLRLVLQFQMPALLGVDHWIRNGAGVKDGISVNVNKIVEIFGILTGHDVTGAIGVGEGIQKGLETALEQLHEWVLGSVLATSAKNGMFKNMRDTSRIRGWCTKGNAKDLVVVITRDRQEFRSTLLVTIKGTVRSIFFHNILLNNFKGRMSHFE
mmetsp:Transcript_13895/g.23032  ORF Transcript_13895/g.23032 Transcript_13895/m.23032 type:complete len:461 (-) Transcript_13895:264-1646(-)